MLAVRFEAGQVNRRFGWGDCGDQIVDFWLGERYFRGRCHTKSAIPEVVYIEFYVDGFGLVLGEIGLADPLCEADGDDRDMVVSRQNDQIGGAVRASFCCGYGAGGLVCNGNGRAWNHCAGSVNHGEVHPRFSGLLSWDKGSQSSQEGDR
jgi:hypothetical protein